MDGGIISIWCIAAKEEKMSNSTKKPVQLSLFDFSDSDLKNGVEESVMNSTPVSSPVFILRIKEVEKRIGFKRSYIYRLMREGKFPQQVRIGLRAVGWSSKDIDQWIEARLNTMIR